MYYVYVLKSQKDNYHYIGHTENITKRLSCHNSGKVKSTKCHLPYKVIYFEEYSTKSDAHKREYYLKKGEGNFWIRKQLISLDIW